MYFFNSVILWQVLSYESEWIASFQLVDDTHSEEKQRETVFPLYSLYTYKKKRGCSGKRKKTK